MLLLLNETLDHTRHVVEAYLNDMMPTAAQKHSESVAVLGDFHTFLLPLVLCNIRMGEVSY